MILDGGTTNVSSAGTRVQISNTVNKVRWIRVKALAGNSGLVYFGTSDVSASNGIKEIPCFFAEVSNNFDSELGRSATIKPSIPASAASSQNLLIPFANIGL